jgi:hypothetical protein
VIVRGSALKHGILEDDCLNAAAWPALTASLDDANPGRQLRLGFDTHGRLLELIVLVWDDGTEELIHAMRARPQYVRLLD